MKSIAAGLMEKTQSKYHKANLAFAAAMDAARRDILDVLVSSPSGLKVLIDTYSAVRRGKDALADSVMIYAPRVTPDEEVAESVIRSRAGMIVDSCLDALERPSAHSILSRGHLIDEMLEVRLPDRVISAVPKIATDSKYCSKRDAQLLDLKTAGPAGRLVDARKGMIEANLGLVDHFLFGYRQRPNYDDFRAEGMIGLIKAVDRWDSKSGLQFSTYAHDWVTGAANRYREDHASTIRIPVYMHSKLNRIEAIETKVLAQYGIVPSSDFIARHLDIPVAKVRKWRGIRRDDQPNYPQLYELDRPGRVAPTKYNPEDAMIVTLDAGPLSKAIDEVLRTLPPTQQRVTRLRHGLPDPDGIFEYGENKTLEEIGQIYKRSKERIRKIEAQAYRMLRHPSRSRSLKAMTDKLDY